MGLCRCQMEWKKQVSEPEGTLGIVNVHPVLSNGETEAQRGELKWGVMPFPEAHATSLLPLKDQACPGLGLGGRELHRDTGGAGSL